MNGVLLASFIWVFLGCVHTILYNDDDYSDSDSDSDSNDDSDNDSDSDNEYLLVAILHPCFVLKLVLQHSLVEE